MNTLKACHALLGNPSYLAASALLVAFATLLSGCASKRAPTRTVFLSDYSRLLPVNTDRARYQSPTANAYHSFMVDPVKILVPAGALDPKERAEAGRYFNQAFEAAVADAGFKIVNAPGVCVGRFRLPFTNVAASTWWKKVHPVASAVGAGSGGAAMEAEVIDCVTEEQVAAVIQDGSGNQFTRTNLSTLADVKLAINGWTRLGAEHLKDL